MRKIYNLFFTLKIPPLLLSSCLIATLVTTISLENSLRFSARADSPPISSNEVTSYAQAVLSMEPVRQDAFKRIKLLINGQNVPKIVCNQPSSINSLSDEAKDIVVKYCNRSQKIVEDNGLTIERFNYITQAMNNDNSLKQQIYDTLIRLQKNPGSR